MLWQGARVRRDILRLPEPDGARSGGDGELRLLILGDSSAAGVGVDRQERALSGCIVRALAPMRIKWRVLAATGWTTSDALAALDTLNGEYDAAVICLGVNDVTTETGIAAWLATYARVLDRLEAAHGISRYYLSCLPPMGRFPALPWPLRWYIGLQAQAHDRALAQLAAGRAGARHLKIDTDLPASAAAADGFHPGPLVYAKLGEVFAEAIRADHDLPTGNAPSQREPKSL